MCFGHQTGAAFNPSRDFGPRLALLTVGYPNTLFIDPYWLYGPWVGALSGGFVGASI
jgi:aquaglyceroporin related protein